MVDKSHRLGYNVTVTLPADVERLIQQERQRKKVETGYKPPRGIVISEAVRAYLGNGNRSKLNKPKLPVKAKTA